MIVGITLFVFTWNSTVKSSILCNCIMSIPDVFKKKEKRNEKRNPIQPFAEFHLKINKRLRAGYGKYLETTK